MKPWVLLPLAGLLGSSACGDRCNPNANVGGGSGALQTFAEVRLLEPSQAFGSAEVAQRELVGLLGVDAFIVAQGDMDGRVDVLLGAGPEGLEVHASVLAVAGAEDRLAERYALEPMMFRQVRIRPAQGRTRCMLFNERIACALGEARLSQGVLALDRLARDADTSLDGANPGIVARVGEPLMTMRVRSVDLFAAHVVPRVLAFVDDALGRAEAPASLRRWVRERDPHEVGVWLARYPWTLRARGARLLLVGVVPAPLPDGWDARAVVPELAGLSWLTVEEDDVVSPMRSRVAGGAAPVVDGGAAPDGGAVPVVDREAAARALVDLAKLLAGPRAHEATAELRLFRSGGETLIEIEMDRAGLVGWLHTMSANSGGQADLHGATDHAAH